MSASGLAGPSGGATFLLVHGAFHGSWCWQRLTPLLEARGHIVEAIDLSRTDDPMASADALLAGWAAQVVAHATAHPDPVILVGHSRAGLVISQAAEDAPERFARLIYCAAMLVDDGETMARCRARLGDGAAAPLRFHSDGTGTALVLDPASAAAVIYPGSTPADQAWATARMTAEPRAGFGIAPRLTAARYGTVPRAAIECLRDAVMSVPLQRGMRESQPCDRVVTLDCDHAPYLSQPERLSVALDEIARTPRQP